MATGDVNTLRAVLDYIIESTEEEGTRAFARQALDLTYRDKYKQGRADPVRGSMDSETVRAFILQTYEEMKQELGREPSNREVGKRTNMDGGRISEALGSK